MGRYRTVRSLSGRDYARCDGAASALPRGRSACADRRLRVTGIWARSVSSSDLGGSRRSCRDGSRPEARSRRFPPRYPRARRIDGSGADVARWFGVTAGHRTRAIRTSEGRDYSPSPDGPFPSGARCLEGGVMPARYRARTLRAGTSGGRSRRRRSDLFGCRCDRPGAPGPAPCGRLEGRLPRVRGRGDRTSRRNRQRRPRTALPGCHRSTPAGRLSTR
jgi:hypothetical protein